jgi:hypothetical protein
MAPATTAELVELQAARRVLFILGRNVITLFALSALQNNVISWHKFLSSQLLAVGDQQRLFD